MSEELERLRAKFRAELAAQAVDKDLRSAPARGDSMVVSVRIRPDEWVWVSQEAKEMAMTPAEFVRYTLRKARVTVPTQ